MLSGVNRIGLRSHTGHTVSFCSDPRLGAPTGYVGLCRLDSRTRQGACQALPFEPRTPIMVGLIKGPRQCVVFGGGCFCWVELVSHDIEGSCIASSGPEENTLKKKRAEVAVRAMFW